MKKLSILCILLLLILIPSFLYVYSLSRQKGKGALQITAVPKSKVFLNGKQIGETPLCRCELADMLPIGDYTVKLVPTESGYTPFEEKIKIGKAVLTVVDATFTGATTHESSIITLSPTNDKKNVDLLVLSLPDKADVFVDKNQVGTTPLLIKTLTPSDHEVRIKKNGYREKTVRIKTVEGYKLETSITLAVSDVLPSQVIDTSKPASSSGSITPVASAKVLILQTPTGFLNVRNSAALTGGVIGKATPGETYDLLDEQTGWFKIKLTTDIEGWISTQYARKQ